MAAAKNCRFLYGHTDLPRAAETYEYCILFMTSPEAQRQNAQTRPTKKRKEENEGKWKRGENRLMRHARDSAPADCSTSRDLRFCVTLVFCVARAETSVHVH